MQDLHVLITGVHTGLGRALAEGALDRGARVCGISRREPEGLAGRPDWRFTAIDLSRPEEAIAEIERLLTACGPVDLAILNAGTLGPIRDLSAISLDELRAVMELNVWSNKCLIDTLFATGHRPTQVIGISSGASRHGSGGWGPYAISKAALNLLLGVYADEHPATHFLALAPGLIDTPMTREVRRQPRLQRHPATLRVSKALDEGRGATPAEAAARLLDHLDRFREEPSGSYLDIREL